MKTILQTAFICCFCFIAFAQEIQPTDSENRLDNFSNAKRHEISLDVTAALIIPAIQPRYEYILGRYSGVGVDLFFELSDDNTYSELERFSITPFYRQYFFSKEDYGAKGFYAEGFLKAYSYTAQDFITFPTTTIIEDENYFEVAIGASIGWKWVSNSGFMIDAGFGLGRNLGISNEPDERLIPIILRGGVHFGWRF